MLINLVGGEATGKSTLAQALGQELDAHVVPELLRDFVDTHKRVPRADEQHSVMEAQSESERRALTQWNVVIGDPAPVMTAVYSQLYYDDDSLFALARIMGPPSDLVIWCGTDFTWQADGNQRDGPEFRDAANTIIEIQVVPDLLVRGIDVLHVTGPQDKRLHAVLTHLRQGVAPQT